MLTFKSEEERSEALATLPDEPPPGADVEAWQQEQSAKEREILEATIEATATELDPKPSEVIPPVEENSSEETVVPLTESEDEYVDFSVLGKVKRSELPEGVQQYKSPQEILEQAAHARLYANRTESKLHDYEQQISELKSATAGVPELKKQLDALTKASTDTRQAISDTPKLSRKGREDLNGKLDTINTRIAQLQDYGGEDTEALQAAISGTVDIFKGTFEELDTVQTEFASYRETSETRYKALEDRIAEVANLTTTANKKRNDEIEQKTAESNLVNLQNDFPELGTSRPLYSEDRKDVESAIVALATKVYGRKPKNFAEVNRLVGAYNSKDAQLLQLCKTEGVTPADYGINDRDVRNYAICMDVFWRQRGERVDSQTGNRVPVTDWRGQKVTFPDFKSTFQHMKDSGGITQAEQELNIINAEKNGQDSLNQSLSRRDNSTPTLAPTGAPPEGQSMSEDMAQEIIGEKPGRMTVDEERMERLLRMGDKLGWEMFGALQRAHATLKLDVPQPEDHWKKVA